MGLTRLSGEESLIRNGLLRNMHKITYTSSRLWGGSVTRLTGRREYVHVGLTAAIPAADTCQSSHRTPSNSCRSYFMLVP